MPFEQSGGPCSEVRISAVVGESDGPIIPIKYLSFRYLVLLMLMVSNYRTSVVRQYNPSYPQTVMMSRVARAYRQLLLYSTPLEPSTVDSSPFRSQRAQRRPVDGGQWI